MRTGWRKRVAKQNNLLGEELGRTWTGDPRYKWVWSEDQEFYRSKLVVYKDAAGKLDPAYVTKSHPGETLVRVEPQYTREKLLPKLVNCFVICRWLANGGFEEFKSRFGDKLEWPGEGSYFPVEHSRGVVQLFPNQEPGDEDTWDFIKIHRKDTQLGMAGIMAQIEAGEKAAEARALDKNRGRLSDLLPAYDHIPGKRGSGGIWARGGEQEFGGYAILGADQYAQTATGVGDSRGDSVAPAPAPIPKPPRSSQIMDQGKA